jgi:hypothetical protein
MTAVERLSVSHRARVIALGLQPPRWRPFKRRAWNKLARATAEQMIREMCVAVWEDAASGAIVWAGQPVTMSGEVN